LKENQGLSENVETLIGQIEGKVDMQELESCVKIDFFEDRLIKIREYIDN